MNNQLFQSHPNRIVVRDTNNTITERSLKELADRVQVFDDELHEISSSKYGSKLFYDFEFYGKKSKNLTAHIHRIIMLIIQRTRFELWDRYVCDVKFSDFAILKGSRMTTGGWKYSYHVILTGWYFKSLPMLREFVEGIHEFYQTIAHAELLSGKFMDMAPYRNDVSKTSSIRIPFTTKRGQPDSKLKLMKMFPIWKDTKFSLHGDTANLDVEYIQMRDFELKDLLVSYNMECQYITGACYSFSEELNTTPDVSYTDVLPEKLAKLMMSKLDDGLQMTHTNILKRVHPGFCAVCKREHSSYDSQFIYKNGNLFVCCFATKGKSIPISACAKRSEPAQQIDFKGLFSTPNIIEFNNKYCIEFPEVRTLAVRSSMGSGKTVQLMKTVETAKGRICMLSFRKSFTIELSQKLGFASYLECNPRTADRLIIQVDSLGKIAGCQYDILICDEIESIIEQMTSSQISNKPLVISVFKSLLMNTPRVIALDANLGDKSDYLLQMRDQEYTLLLNTYSSFEHQTITEVPSKNRLFELMDACLKKSENIAFITNSKSVQSKFVEFVNEHYPQISKLIINGDTSPQMKKEVAQDPNTHMKVQFLSFTPTITAGTNFDVSDWFDTVFCYFTNASTSVLTSRQMMRRIRHITKNHFYIHFHTMDQNLPEDIPSIENFIANNYAEIQNNRLYRYFSEIPVEFMPNGQIEFPFKDLGYDISLLNIQSANKDINSFKKRFLEQERKTGVQINKDRYKKTERSYLREMNTLFKSITKKQAEHLVSIAEAWKYESDELEYPEEYGFNLNEMYEIQTKYENEEPLSADEMDKLTIMKYRKTFKQEPTVETLINAGKIYKPWFNRSCMLHSDCLGQLKKYRTNDHDYSNTDVGAIASVRNSYIEFKTAYLFLQSLGITRDHFSGATLEKSIIEDSIKSLTETIPKTKLNEHQINLGVTVSDWGDLKKNLEVLNAIYSRHFGIRIVKANNRCSDSNYKVKQVFAVPEPRDVIPNLIEQLFTQDDFTNVIA